MPGTRPAGVLGQWPRRHLSRLAEAARIVTVTQPALTGALVTQWINDSRAEELLHWRRRETAARYEIAAKHLAGLNSRGHKAPFTSG